MADKFYDQEDMMDAVKDLLETNLSAAIDELNLLKPDAFQIEMPLAFHIGYRFVDPNQSIGKSVVIITPGSVEGEKFNPGVTEEETFIDVIVVYWGQKSEEVERKTLRYTRVIRQVLDATSLFKDVTPVPTNVGDSVVASLMFNLTDFEGEIYFKSATVRLRVKDLWCYED